ncbi:unnamed protein product [Allacma fusca]|uniref:Uncharacterized protein n=1 Tax=Allacma fusca TaxID=39272 RepID=A0A8J2LIK8_9HEXA|nr:unnamed protein product [Allacma fusca]
MAQKTFILGYTILAVTMTTLASPPKLREETQPVGQSAFGNLKLTFDSPDDIPSAFFDEPSKTRRDAAEESPKSPTPRKIYPGCNDGSGGMCVPQNECPADKRPENSSPGACKPNYECCFDVPVSDKSCQSKGGECVAASFCGGAPKAQNTECSGVNGQVCCILV